jgi:MoxR-like ATPase
VTDRNDPNYFYVDGQLPEYLKKILEATRAPQEHGLPQLAGALESGAPEEDFDRIMGIAKEYAVRAGRKYMVPEDIRSAAEDTLGLTLILSGRAEAEGLEIEDVVCKILDSIATP